MSDFINKPLITVAIATFNAERTIQAAISSILSQSFNDLEILIIDGLSTDKTLSKVSEFESPKITVISERDSGIYDAWNKAANAAKGDWVLFIGADDKLTSESAIYNFVTSCKAADAFSSCDVIYGDLLVNGSDGKIMDRIGGAWKNPWRLTGRYITSSFPIPIMSALFRRECIILNKGFCLDYKIIADIELVIRISKRGNILYLPNNTLTEMGYGGVSTNPNRAITLLKESFFVRRKHSLGTATNIGFWGLAIRQLLKYSIYKLCGKHAAYLLISTYQKSKRAKMS